MTLQKGRYDMILGRDILTALGWILKFSDIVIELDNGTLKRSTVTIADISMYEFKDLNKGNITPK